MDKDLADVLTMKEAITLLKVSRNTLMIEIRQHSIPFMKIGRQYRFRRVDVEQYLERKVNEETCECKM